MARPGTPGRAIRLPGGVTADSNLPLLPAFGLILLTLTANTGPSGDLPAGVWR
jgi:hypothetical protein